MMKKILISITILLLLILTSCSSNSPDDYHIISHNQVDGYDIYKLDQKGMFCNTNFEDIYYSGKDYNYGFSFEGCDPSMAFFIKKDEEFIYLQDAIDQGFIKLDDLMPELEKLVRHPEEIQSDEADYYWLDFHIDHQVVYAYAGGECDNNSSEFFIINNKEYFYNASGCLKDHILFMKEDGKFVPVSTLLAENKIDGKYLIPLLTEKSPS